MLRPSAQLKEKERRMPSHHNVITIRLCSNVHHIAILFAFSAPSSISRKKRYFTFAFRPPAPSNFIVWSWSWQLKDSWPLRRWFEVILFIIFLANGPATFKKVDYVYLNKSGIPWNRSKTNEELQLTCAHSVICYDIYKSTHLVLKFLKCAQHGAYY